ncbi:hypothetical protein HY478_03375 [Candidatus Uhrbacteria bacterium]|nr:hypothetical protein [Candidatus Uhrbacteria bacterium]
METSSLFAIIVALFLFMALTSWLERTSLLGRYERYMELIELARSHYWSGQEAREELRELLLNGETSRRNLARAIVTCGKTGAPETVVRQFLDEEADELRAWPHVVYFHGERLRKLLERFSAAAPKAPTTSSARAPEDS